MYRYDKGKWSIFDYMYSKKGMIKFLMRMIHIKVCFEEIG